MYVKLKFAVMKLMIVLGSDFLIFFSHYIISMTKPF